jgi:hypothetical protein
MAIHCWKYAARAITLPLLLHFAAMAVVAQSLHATATASPFVQPFESEVRGFEQSSAFRYQQSVTDQFAGEPHQRAQHESADENSFRSNRGLRRHTNWKVFVPLSAAVYTMGLLDQTATIGHRYWRINEEDPLVKPFTQVPAPVFVAGGVLFETGVNWLAWRMGRSRRWHQIGWLPQLCAVGANAYGYDISTHY